MASHATMFHRRHLKPEEHILVVVVVHHRVEPMIIQPMDLIAKFAMSRESKNVLHSMYR